MKMRSSPARLASIVGHFSKQKLVASIQTLGFVASVGYLNLHLVGFERIVFIAVQVLAVRLNRMLGIACPAFIHEQGIGATAIRAKAEAT